MAKNTTFTVPESEFSTLQFELTGKALKMLYDKKTSNLQHLKKEIKVYKESGNKENEKQYKKLANVVKNELSAIEKMMAFIDNNIMYDFENEV